MPCPRRPKSWPPAYWPAPALQRQGAQALQLVIGVAHGVEVDAQGHGHLAHGGQPLARPHQARADGLQDMVAQLDVDRHPVAFEREAAKEAIGSGVGIVCHCMHELIQ